MKAAYLFCGLLLAALSGHAQPADGAFTLTGAQAYAARQWATLPARLQRIQPPDFPERDFVVVRGSGDDRGAILRAIHACSAAGGGRVVLPPGAYFSRGPLHLESNVNLHISAGSRLTFSQEPLDYTPLVEVRWEGTVAYNFSPFIYANGKRNVAITGSGTIDGGAVEWSKAWRDRQDADKDRLRDMGANGVPDDQRVFGHGFLDLDGDGQDDGHGSGRMHYLRPTLIELYDCENLLIEGVTLTGSCFWTVHPVFSRNVTVRNVSIRGGYLNDDGIDPDSCQDVLIEGCTITTEDDAISIKAGRDRDALGRGASRNIIIRDCRLASGVNALCVGSEMSGGVHEIFAENCHLLSGTHALNFKTNLDRGGRVSDIFARRLTAGTLTEELVSFRMDYHGYRGGRRPTEFSDIYLQDIRADRVGQRALSLVGVAESPIRRVLLEDLSIDSVPTPGELAHTRDLLLSGVTINGQSPVTIGRYTQVQHPIQEEKPATGVFLITDYGATTGGLATAAIQRTIDAAKAGGGGVVVVPPGRFVTGTLFLASDLTLHLRPGARLLGSTRLEDYSDEHPHLIYARDANNLSITGSGTIDGQGEAFFDKQGDTGERSNSLSWRALPRPTPWIELEDCRGITIRDVNLVNSPAHVLSLTRSRHIVIDGITILNDARSPNTDGIDIRDSRDVRISNCRIETGDDAICLKSKQDTVSNVLVTNCYLRSDDAGIKFGTGTAVAIRDCRFSNLVIDSTRYGIALFMLDGGVNEYCSFDNITIRNGSRHATEYPIFVDVDKRYPDRALGIQRHLSSSNLDIFTRNQLLLAGQPGAPIEHLRLSNLRIHAERCRNLAQIDRKPKGNKSLQPDPRLSDYAGRDATLILGHLRQADLQDIRIYQNCASSDRDDRLLIDVITTDNQTPPKR